MRLVLFTLLAFEVQAQCIGVAWYGGMSDRFPCRQAVEVFKRSPCIATSVVWGTFGYDDSCLRHLVQSFEKPTILIHFSNECCRRWGRCGKGELLRWMGVKELDLKLRKMNRSVLSALLRRTRRILWMTVNVGDARWILSTGLEDNFSPGARAVVKKWLRKEWPYEIIENPASDACTGGKCELHHSENVTDDTRFYSNDGHEPDFSDRWDSDSSIRVSTLLSAIRRARENGGYSFLWSGEFQGLNGGGFTQPRRRDFRILPETIHQLNRILLTENKKVAPPL